MAAPANKIVDIINCPEIKHPIPAINTKAIRISLLKLLMNFTLQILKFSITACKLDTTIQMKILVYNR